MAFESWHAFELDWEFFSLLPDAYDNADLLEEVASRVALEEQTLQVPWLLLNVVVRLRNLQMLHDLLDEAGGVGLKKSWAFLLKDGFGIRIELFVERYHYLLR